MTPRSGSLSFLKADQTPGMCAEFVPSALILEFARRHGAILNVDSAISSAYKHILPHTKAPVLHPFESGLAVSEMIFSLTPAWSKERRVSFSTFNARLDSVMTKPTWKLAFARKRALVLIEGWIEPCYRGEFAGSMVRFSPAPVESSDLPPTLLCAALYDRWVDNRSKEELLSFALITDRPGPEVQASGHDRQPLFINPPSIDAWLNPTLTDPKQVLALIPSITMSPSLDAKVERAMKPGWEKRSKKR